MKSKSILSKHLLALKPGKTVIQHHRVVKELPHIFLAAFCRLQLTHIIYSAGLQNPYGYGNSQYCTKK